MNEPTTQTMAAFAAARAAKPRSRIQTLPVEFTGTGTGYFRIWIVNLLLILITLSLYTPWARARKLRYFYCHTLVDGHPLAFHGDARKMFHGYLLVGAMAVVYWVAGRFSTGAGLAAFLILALLWPALLKSSMQFRLANTSWRGLRFRFSGTVSGAYAVVLPVFVPSAILLGLGSKMALEQGQTLPAWFGWSAVAMIPGLLLIAPWVWWRLKKYQHDHLAYAGQETRFKASVGSFFGVFLKTAGVTAACWAMVTVLSSIVVISVMASSSAMGLIGALLLGLSQNTGLMWLVLLASPLLALGGSALYGVWAPYFTARMQNLVWSQTGNYTVRFESALTFRRTLRLTLKNWLLIGLTLGLYWPFAAVTMARLKLEAMSVQTRVDPQALIDRARAHDGEAAGDAAGDVFGVDVGL
jgi:uncharacterized membrane protein YjgN (DUF898 family)